MLDIYRGVTTCTINAGDSVLLWKDFWTGHNILQDQLPRLFSFSVQEDVTISTYYLNNDPIAQFALPLLVEAASELDVLNRLIDDLDRDMGMPDQWLYVWGVSEYRTKKFYKFFFRDIIPVPVLPLIWKTKCVMKLKVFAWLLIQDRLNTRDMLARRHCPISDISCVICQM